MSEHTLLGRIGPLPLLGVMKYISGGGVNRDQFHLKQENYPPASLPYLHCLRLQPVQLFAGLIQVSKAKLIHSDAIYNNPINKTRKATNCMTERDV